MKKKRITDFDTIVVGAGASGMAAAINAAAGKQTVLLIEKLESMGKKILVTGNGKCNLTNLDQKPQYFRTENPEELSLLLNKTCPENIRKFFYDMGIPTKERNGYVYPYNEQASCVREALEERILQNGHITFLPETEVIEVKKQNTFFFVKTRSKKGKKEQYNAISVIISTGGYAGPKFGCDGSGFRMAEELGHDIIPPLPALTALKSSAPFLKKVSGVRNQAAITLEINGKAVAKEQGELQWTDYGISGVAIFQLSHFAVIALENKEPVVLYFDFMPEFSEKEKRELLVTLKKENREKKMLLFTKGIFPAKLSPVILREAKIEGEKKVCEVAGEEWENYISAFSHFPLKIKGYAGYEKAQVTRGGVSLSNLDAHLESRIVPGLFFAGEVTDVDGICGGYNLHWAFSSGQKAGMAARERNQQIYDTNCTD
ncbi:MAG: aminoacetone oxidase family FAD-binding enzyme [Eubacterium sp.]|nr:aminoacetone oxidase family FAD-binding enzyme [Eubacterium sp.]MDD7210101.1 aminoacetone oxidase family FAD-binding enzyme [Lachnospiraceae bacterium]MDY5497732.1 aminoacetone oxidase family FAD-binding enzyme [Anaerobutyricum sp.]